MGWGSIFLVRPFGNESPYGLEEAHRGAISCHVEKMLVRNIKLTRVGDNLGQVFFEVPCCMSLMRYYIFVKRIIYIYIYICIYIYIYVRVIYDPGYY